MSERARSRTIKRDAPSLTQQTQSASDTVRAGAGGTATRSGNNAAGGVGSAGAIARLPRPCLDNSIDRIRSKHKDAVRRVEPVAALEQQRGERAVVEVGALESRQVE